MLRVARRAQPKVRSIRTALRIPMGQGVTQPSATAICVPLARHARTGTRMRTRGAYMHREYAVYVRGAYPRRPARGRHWWLIPNSIA
eukprot:COSAG06_NODE_48116_length_334_cov_1.063830_1_plen_86_part_10